MSCSFYFLFLFSPFKQLQAWIYIEAMASVAPGFGLGALRKLPTDFKIFQWKCPFQSENGLALWNMFKNEIPGLQFNCRLGLQKHDVQISWRQSERTKRNVELSTTGYFHSQYYSKEIYTLCRCKLHLIDILSYPLSHLRVRFEYCLVQWLA